MLLRPRSFAWCPRHARAQYGLLPEGEARRTKLRKIAPREIDFERDGSNFQDVERELKRRKSKVDAKRNQFGTYFVDYTTVTVRGGEFVCVAREREMAWLHVF